MECIWTFLDHLAAIVSVFGIPLMLIQYSRLNRKFTYSTHAYDAQTGDEQSNSTTIRID